jgi:hypothetical protein
LQDVPVLGAAGLRALQASGAAEARAYDVALNSSWDTKYNSWAVKNEALHKPFEV